MVPTKVMNSFFLLYKRYCQGLSQDSCLPLLITFFISTSLGHPYVHVFVFNPAGTWNFPFFHSSYKTDRYNFYSTSFSSSSTEMLNNFAKANRLDVLGSDMPCSHFETDCLLTPTASATNSCVILFFVR